MINKHYIHIEFEIYNNNETNNNNNNKCHRCRIVP